MRDLLSVEMVLYKGWHLRLTSACMCIHVHTFSPTCTSCHPHKHAYMHTPVKREARQDPCISKRQHFLFSDYEWCKAVANQNHGEFMGTCFSCRRIIIPSIMMNLHCVLTSSLSMDIDTVSPWSSGRQGARRGEAPCHCLHLSSLQNLLIINKRLLPSLIAVFTEISKTLFLYIFVWFFLEDDNIFFFLLKKQLQLTNALGTGMKAALFAKLSL